jgi:hypothetical protein
VPDRYEHRPWADPGGPPAGYPAPIVDHAEERAEALRRYEAIPLSPLGCPRGLALGTIECQATRGCTMLDERKAAILRAVVEEYIDTAQPVGSAHVAKAPGVSVSSATVRNDMAALEQEGYLRQPHTSAGRVPTEKGYRFFVDALGQPPTLRGAKAEQVRSFFEQAHGELEHMLHETSTLLGNLTSYAGVVIGPPPAEAHVRSVQLVALAPTAVLAVVVLSNGMVEKHTLDLAGVTGPLADGAGEERVGAASPTWPRTSWARPAPR